ncbi:phospholipase A2 inhibitor and Ly6/PLAUR domain-containing protein-like [Heteronotia binoei]|uniref:phospholipase A2 inhibitor and Ly6/PLAUR domain-containing protein-like n=1 Tax=Heteronotia binoei TaxID=13085 RepID=UPI002930041B|nr:phospholipase A2 inhibitor and Ly6/PLAUR domain-containing protein-like [Heteronotia binoei]
MDAAGMQTCVAFFILSALVDAVDLLACEDCSMPGNSCDGMMKPCFLGEDTCGTILGETNLGVEGSSGTLKTCTEYKACRAGVMTMTFSPPITLRRGALCLQEESPRNESLILPPKNTTQNGFSCPVCYRQGSESCTTEGTQGCTGSENHCVYVTGMLDSLEDITAATTTFAAKGCATKSVCEPRRGVSVYSGVFSYTIAKIKECRQAPLTKNSANVHHISWTKPISLFLLAISIASASCFLSHTCLL